MWNDSPANYSGNFYQVKDVFCEPKPTPNPILMLGGGGEKKTLKIVAKHADWWNDVMRKPKDLRRKLDALKKHCEDVGRDYNSIRKTIAPRFIIDKDYKKALGQADQMRRNDQIIAGDPSAVIDQLSELRELGFDFVITTFPRFQDLSDMKLFVKEVMPHFL
jgi:alkanesulfonate monooxygenase SsuD/methylene tetrahydromethanopterin reductase-like flavin-dependent oxidoreductase (luciferase family)